MKFLLKQRSDGRGILKYVNILMFGIGGAYRLSQSATPVLLRFRAGLMLKYGYMYILTVKLGPFLQIYSFFYNVEKSRRIRMVLKTPELPDPAHGSVSGRPLFPAPHAPSSDFLPLGP